VHVEHNHQSRALIIHMTCHRSQSSYQLVVLGREVVLREEVHEAVHPSWGQGLWLNTRNTVWMSTDGD